MPVKCKQMQVKAQAEVQAKRRQKYKQRCRQKRRQKNQLREGNYHAELFMRRRITVPFTDQEGGRGTVCHHAGGPETLRKDCETF